MNMQMPCGCNLAIDPGWTIIFSWLLCSELPELPIPSYWVTIKFRSVVLQVMAYAQQSRESSKHEQAALNDRMQEYKRHVDQESRQSLKGSHGSSPRDAMQTFSRGSHNEIKAVMQSAAEGQVFNMIFLSSLSIILPFFLFLLSCIHS